MFFQPFVKTPEPEIAVIGNDEIGYIHLLRKYALSPIEQPSDGQKGVRMQAQSTALVFQAVKNYSDRHGVSEEEARAVIMSSKPDLQVMDYLSEKSKVLYQKLIDEVVDSYADKEKLSTEESQKVVFQAMLPTLGQVGANLFDYFNAAQTVEYLELTANSRDLPVKAATHMIRNRVVYPVLLAATGRIDSTQIEVEPLTFPLSKGDRVRCGGVTFEVAKGAAAGSVLVQTVELPQEIGKGSCGYLLDPETGKIKCGTFRTTASKSLVDTLLSDSAFNSLLDYLSEHAPDLNANLLKTVLRSWAESQSGWSPAQTSELFDEQIQALFEFYQSEKDGVRPALEDDSEGNSIKSLNGSTSTPPPRSSNGKSSTGKSSSQESLIPV